jgi:hypothetical protein
MEYFTLERFPDEILLEIFKYVRFNVLFNTFVNLNSRFNGILCDVHPPVKVGSNRELQAALYFAPYTHHLFINKSTENELHILSLNLCYQIRSLNGANLTASQMAFIRPSNMPELRHLSTPFSKELLKVIFGPVEKQFLMLNSCCLSGGPHPNFCVTKYHPCASLRSLHLRSGYNTAELCCLLALAPNLRKLKLVTYMATQGLHLLQDLPTHQQNLYLTHLDLVVATSDNTIPNERNHIIWHLAPNVESVRLFMWLSNASVNLTILYRAMMRAWPRLRRFTYLFRIENTNETVDSNLIRTQLMPLFSQIKQQQWRVEPRVVELYTNHSEFLV